MSDLEKLKGMVLAPWIFKATALISVPRRVGGNQFRHSMATFSILIDYKCIDPVILKAAIVHDLCEDVPTTQIRNLLVIDKDSEKVVELVLELTRGPDETKAEYLTRLRDRGSEGAKLVKCADRISNLTDLHLDIFTREKFLRYLVETEEFVIPMAREVNSNMLIEISDLLAEREELLH